jgi:iron complex transport system substrate-binding protein
MGAALLHSKKTAPRICVFLSLLVSLGTLAQAKEITDMFGRRLSMPDRPQRVYSASPPVTYMLYALDPAMLAGLNFPVREWEKKYLRKSMQSLPVLGGWFGQGQTPNLEMVLKAKPEIIVVSTPGGAFRSKMRYTVMKTMPMPVVDVALDTLPDYPEAFLTFGRLLGREARAGELASYARKTLSAMAELAGRIPNQRRVSVYYAEGADGLSTDCDRSGHAELIGVAGGRNVHGCHTQNLFGMEAVSLEQVMLYDPDVILVKEPVFFTQVFSDPRWQRVKAVKEKKVYLIPYEPFNWFDRPPSFMRLLGAKWLANLLYPDRYRVSMVKETQEFFRLFLAVSLTPQEAGAILRPQVP